MSIFSDRLKALRIKNNLTQKQMGEVLGCTDRYYQKIEYGTVKPSQENLIKIADHFNVPTDYLLGRDNFLLNANGNIKVKVSADILNLDTEEFNKESDQK